MTADLSFVPFIPGHLSRLRLQAAQDLEQTILGNPGYGIALAEPGLAWTGIIGGEVVGCAGLLPQWPGRAVAWALMGSIPKPAWIRVTAKVRAVFDRAEANGVRRIECTVRHGFLPGHRWAVALGFIQEGFMRGYGPDGSDHWLYARVFQSTSQVALG